MKFTSAVLYDFPTLTTFKELIKKTNIYYIKRKYIYATRMELIEDKYFWMYVQFENRDLYNAKVFDIEDETEKENPRPQKYVELRHQLFICYDIEKRVLYLSDYSKRNWLSDYIKHFLQKEVYIKNIYKSVDEFANICKTIKSASFTQTKNLYSTAGENSIFQKQANIYGLDLPEKSKITFDYGKNATKIVRELLNRWKRQYESGIFDEIVLIGMDDDGFENSFNFSTVLSAIEFQLKKESDDRYDEEKVKNSLISKLGE